jgi:hypothetical protein
MSSLLYSFREIAFWRRVDLLIKMKINVGNGLAVVAQSHDFRSHDLTHLHLSTSALKKDAVHLPPMPNGFEAL